MAEMHQNTSFAGGRYMPTQSSDGQKNYVNFFYMTGIQGNLALGGGDPNELYGALEKLNLVRNGKHNFDPTKLRLSARPENDKENYIPLPPPPPPESKCALCYTTGDAEKVRKISELRLEVCKACLKTHWKADFEQFWNDSNPK